MIQNKIRSAAAVNMPAPPTRGQTETYAVNTRSRFYVLRQDKNQVLVYDSNTYNLIATLRTGNTPISLAITFDRKFLLVGNDNSQIANRYDLDSLTAVQPILFPLGHYPRSIAVSGK